MRKKYKSQTYQAELIRQRMRSVLWSNDQPTDELIKVEKINIEGIIK